MAFCLALDESTDIPHIPQLAIFIRYANSNDNFKEEMLDFVSLNETTRGDDDLMDSPFIEHLVAKTVCILIMKMFGRLYCKL